MLKLNGNELLTGRFPNEELEAKDLEYALIEGENVLEFKFDTNEDLIHLMFVKKRLDELGVRCTLFIWYMPYSRMDRKIDGVLFTLKYVCEYINWLNFAKVIVMEPHSDVTMELLERAKAIYPVKDWLPNVQKEIGFSDKDHIVFPDKGAAARYADCGYPNVCIMEKHRFLNAEGRRRMSMILKEGKVNPNSKCIIIDDLCSKGGTFSMAADILKQNGASEVFLIVSHCEKNIFNGKLLKENSAIEAIYTSRSMMDDVHPMINYMPVDVMEYAKH